MLYMQEITCFHKVLLRFSDAYAVLTAQEQVTVCFYLRNSQAPFSILACVTALNLDLGLELVCVCVCAYKCKQQFCTQITTICYSTLSCINLSHSYFTSLYPHSFRLFSYHYLFALLPPPESPLDSSPVKGNVAQNWIHSTNYLWLL